jgi:Na+-driven multidrug efflux pump
MISFYILIICVTISIILAIAFPIFNVDFTKNNRVVFVFMPFGFLFIYFLAIGVFWLISTIYMRGKEEGRVSLILSLLGGNLVGVGLIVSFVAKRYILTIPIIGVALILISILLKMVQKFRKMVKEYG